MKIKVILASTREKRQGEQFASWVMDEVAKITDADFELLDLRDYQLPYYSDSVPASYLTSPYVPEIRSKWAEKINEADGFIIITPEYNHSFPAVLKSALDSVYSEWNNKPVAFVSYGGSANGARSVEHLKLVAIELQMAPIREGVHIGIFQKDPVFADGFMIDESNTRRLTSMTTQLLWWTDALKKARLKS